MPPRSDAKKPSGGRPTPKRLWSLDHLRRDRSSSGSGTDEADIQADKNPFRARQAEKTILEHLDDPFIDQAQYSGRELVTSPELLDGPESVFRLSASKIAPPALDLGRSGAVASGGLPPPSPSRRRWETIRHHVMPPASSPPPDSSSTPDRPSTPKLGLFTNRKAFQKVVETAQTQSHLDSRRLSDALWKACWAAHVPHKPRPEREGTLGALGNLGNVNLPSMGSSLHLPFMTSTTSLQIPGTATSSLISFPNSLKNNAIRRPQSTTSLATAAGPVSAVSKLVQALASTSSANRPRQLPHESFVLSALLMPFTKIGHSSQDEEQSVAVETFESIHRSWAAPTVQAELERCIWCCKAASIPSASKMRILGTLSAILFSRGRSFVADSPMVLQTLLRALFSLQYNLIASQSAAAEVQSIAGYISAIQTGSCGQLIPTSVEKEFGIPLSDNDNEAVVREAVITEGVVSCIETGPADGRRWAMLTVANYWPAPEPNVSFTPLLACIHWRKLKRFLSTSLFLLSEPSQDMGRYAEVMITLIRTRIMPEIDGLSEEDAPEIRSKAIQLVLELICLGADDGEEYLLMRLCDWYQKDKTWKGSIEAALEEIIAQSEWLSTLRVIPTLVSVLPNELQASILAFVLPAMHKRLVNDPPELPNPALSQFLDSTSRLFPKIFYKPLFICAAANKDVTVVNQLCTLNALSKLVPDILTRDAEMMSVALVSDTATVSQSTSTDDDRRRGVPRIGQAALLIELIERLRQVHSVKDMGLTAAHVKFASALEARLGMAIEEKEKSMDIALSHRLLFCALFREIRLLTRSLKSATWLSSVVEWTLYLEEMSRLDDAYREVTDTMRRLELVYGQAEDNTQRNHKRRPTVFSPLSAEMKTAEYQEPKSASLEHFRAKIKLASTIPKSVKQTALDLLVAMSAMLEADHYERLGPMLWNECLLAVDEVTPAAGCFLFMQYAEKRPIDCAKLMKDAMISPDPVKRRTALEKFAVLSTWRYQILSQEVVLDRNHRRPFKLQRPPVLFVATDIGSSLFIYEDDNEEYRDIHGHVMPLELRRRLSEIGWAQEDRPIDPRMQRIKTPMTLLPSQQFERLDSTSQEGVTSSESHSHDVSPEPSPKSSPASSPISRRDSNASTRQSTRRRPVFVPTLVALFPRISVMLADEDFVVANLARDILMDFMRDDPTLVAREVFQIISGNDQDVSTAISTLRAFLHIRNVLPPAMSHYIFNHVTGFLKTSVKQIGSADPLRAFAYAVPILAKLVTQVSKLSIREVRRAKVDPFMMPTGSLWFLPNAPVTSLFPKSLEASGMHPFSEVPPNLVWITMIRTSQNMLFLSMLKRNPQDIKTIRKNMSDFELPALNPDGIAPTLSLQDMFPHRRRLQRGPRSKAQITLTSLSLTLSRSYLLLLEQVFQCMSRHLSDREELALFIGGLVRILLVHGDDIGIARYDCLLLICHAYILYLALMTAATRFKRLFISGGGYTLFMPAVFKTFVEAEEHPNIRRAILYATNRFYALHQESFIFQSFDAIAPILAVPEVDGEWVAPSIFGLFSSLKNGFAPGTPDAAGIHDMNRAQEREALIMTIAEEVPQTFMASIKRSAAKDDKSLAMTIPEEYEGKRLKLDDLIKLFLTVIAHNPASPRAEYFLRSLRLLTPHMHDTTRSVQTVLRGGILALGSILSNKVLTRQPKEASKEKSVDEAKYEALADAAPSKIGDGQASGQSDFLAMRLEYLLLVTAFTKAGGHIGNPQSLTSRVLEIIKIVLRDSKTSGEKVSLFLANFVHSALMRKNAPSLKEATAIVEAFVPLTSSYMAASVDFSRLYTVLSELMDNPVLGCDLGFSKLIVSQFCRLGLDACEAAASEDFLFTFPLREALVKLLVSSVANCGSEVMSELEKQPLSHNFLAGIILPMALMLKTSTDIMERGQWKDSWQRDAYSKVWLRLLALVLGVLKGDQMVADPAAAAADRRKSSGDPASKAQSFASVKAFSIALQVLKIIVVRAQDDISVAFPGVWIHVAGVLKTVLENGNAMFAFSFRDISEPPSPAFSPRIGSFERQQPFSTFASSNSIHSRRRLSPPRMIDYLTWSFVQWLWLRRSPLMLQMRIFIQERVANLSNELRQQGSQSISAVTSTSRRSQRYSTIFSKPRKSMLGGYSPSNSATSTPRASALLQGSVSLPVFSDFTSPKLTASHSLDPSRQAGYARMPSPISPSGRTSQDSLGPKIVHLGPVNPYTAPGVPRPSFDVRPDTSSTSLLAKEMIVRSPGLVMMTYRRIRLVQKLMGYSELLPMGGSQFYASIEEAEGDLDADIRVWSQRDAIDAVVEETRELLDEFRESFGDVGDESLVMVDSQLTLIQDQM
ncbi:uncharacterized protein PHACADRAFT_139496 [Phanerochaete carnosa HHB-10118-sp]|uniref:Uncharacterized protein n=1 Tax=Phanerochaete carnosa (strain HHB-10118-sp) TaxID=650164 RepID=K5WFB5_PHACS|nr:uncharacterized protein PHACADRAFT_139496 [Phanerochaete carnosa HHB-10118-sp]EKM57985.1 hypothetical protein PHACADRAFT_139496 [Phanerochaete carnosa HHB-10118-sp]